LKLGEKSFFSLGKEMGVFTQILDINENSNISTNLQRISTKISKYPRKFYDINENKADIDKTHDSTFQAHHL
jgi:hypothetical protein